VNSQNVLIPESSQWQQVEDTSVAVVGIEGLKRVKQARLKLADTRLIVWHWYHIAGDNTVNDYLAKLYGVQGKLLKDDESATGIVLYMPYVDTTEKQTETMSSFANVLLPWFAD